jgi:OOP family OmpA-OmpF porin
MLLAAVAGALGTSVAVSAFAQSKGDKANLRATANPAGWYLGGAIGRTGYDTDYSGTMAELNGVGATGYTVNADYWETTGRVFLGYQFTRNVSLEASYWKLGKVSYSAVITSPVSTTANRDFDSEGAGADVVLWLPLMERLWALGKVGAMAVKVKATAVDVPGLQSIPSESSHTVNLHLGAGLEYRLTPQFSGRFEYDFIYDVGDNGKFGTADLHMWSLGANYRF